MKKPETLWFPGSALISYSVLLVGFRVHIDTENHLIDYTHEGFIVKYFAFAQCERICLSQIVK